MNDSTLGRFIDRGNDAADLIGIGRACLLLLHFSQPGGHTTIAQSAFGSLASAFSGGFRVSHAYKKLRAWRVAAQRAVVKMPRKKPGSALHKTSRRKSKHDFSKSPVPRRKGAGLSIYAPRPEPPAGKVKMPLACGRVMNEVSDAGALPRFGRRSGTISTSAPSGS